MNDNFLEDFNQGHFGDCGHLYPSFKKRKQNNQPANISLPALLFQESFLFFFFFLIFFPLLLKLILVLIKFFISDTVLVRAIVRFLL